MPTSIDASEFVATCLDLLDEVAEARAEYVIERHGRPVARLIPCGVSGPLRGSVSFPDPSDDLLSCSEWREPGSG